MERILFVCTANICRSPIAETIFNALAEDKGLPFRAGSAGVAALENDPMAPYAITALEEAGFYPKVHRARQVSEIMLEETELVLAMSPRHAAALRRLHEDASPRIHTLPQYATDEPIMDGVPDPYGYTLSAYRNSVRQLYEYVERSVKRLGG